MARFFRNNKSKNQDEKPRQIPPTKAVDLMDPILYQGGLDVAKFPILPTEKERKPREEPENPLNKR